MAQRRDWDKARRYRRAIENGRENVDGSWMVEGTGKLSRTRYVERVSTSRRIKTTGRRPRKVAAVAGRVEGWKTAALAVRSSKTLRRWVVILAAGATLLALLLFTR